MTITTYAKATKNPISANKDYYKFETAMVFIFIG